jgi:hypothetical protein
MAKTRTKYGKYIMSKKLYFKFPRGYVGTSLLSHKGELNPNLCFGYHCINDTEYMHPEPHTHDFDELLGFVGGNPLDITDFPAEIHFCMGKEKEEHVITEPTMISIPAGLEHCPLTVTRCDKPIVMLEISLTKKFDSSEMKAKREKEAAKKKKAAAKKKTAAKKK